VEEAVQGIRVVKSLGRSRLVFDRYDAKATRLRRQQLEKVRTLALLWCVFEFHPQVTLAVILVGGAVAVNTGALTVGGLVGFVALFTVLLWPILSLGFLFAFAQETASACDRIGELLDAPLTVTDRPGVRPAEIDSPARLRFEGVGFTYPGSAHPVLDGIDLEIAPGETVALVGATGSGKTTLVRLLSRLYDPQAGVVAIDGADVRTVDVASLRRSIAVVDDDPFLFSDTVAGNIAYAKPDATREEIERAAERAQAAGFIAGLPNGYDTRVGERGLTLSGGQRQRIAIARAILADPRILVLDDATSSVDASTEREIKAALREVMAGRTTFVIAHRLSTIALADDIVVLEYGAVAARGTHEELLGRSELYAEIAAKGLPDQVFLTQDPKERVAGL
jgi:ATP-binding cassette, subfamily B, bacterial